MGNQAHHRDRLDVSFHVVRGVLDYSPGGREHHGADFGILVVLVVDHGGCRAQSSKMECFCGESQHSTAEA